MGEGEGTSETGEGTRSRQLCAGGNPKAVRFHGHRHSSVPQERAVPEHCKALELWKSEVIRGEGESKGSMDAAVITAEIIVK